ncbi:hypothetical protein ACFQ20_05870 [Pseudoroseomonas ludipueritiae]
MPRSRAPLGIYREEKSGSLLYFVLGKGRRPYWVVSEARLAALKAHIYRMVAIGASISIFTAIRISSKSVSFWFAVTFLGLLPAAAMVAYHVFWLNRHCTRGTADPKDLELSPVT